jgi:hypothetical protein
MTDHRVFIVQKPAYKDRETGKWVDKYDLSPAAHFGKLVYLLPHGNVPQDLATTIEKLQNQLEDFNDRDHILAIGDPVAISATVMVASRQNGGKLSILKWDRRAQGYRPYPIRISV